MTLNHEKVLEKILLSLKNVCDICYHVFIILYLMNLWVQIPAVFKL